MARLYGSASWAEIALVANAYKTMIQLLTASSQQIAITGIAFSLDGINPVSKPLQYELLIQTSAGTASANTPKKTNQALGTSFRTTAQDTFTVEPTASDVLWGGEIHPQGGSIEKVFTPYLPQEIILAAATRIGLRLFLDSGETVINCKGEIFFEE